ncbi:CPBP family intramembrane glutamic endopeptidase [Capilliphycus salinus ALCB114379]|uniref:CPBP family intramembrane glutamic endopeptidase n=1 Tax=Capilliphycus salinus TaxID=2768948 RepID=UPI0039A70410
MKSLKEKALDKILLGVGLKLIPLASLGFLSESFPELLSTDSNSILSLVLSLFVFISCLVGYIFFIKGCCLYIKSKGYSSNWGWLGILSLLILPIFFFIPSRLEQFSVQSENAVNEPFERINIPEILLFIFLGMSLLIYFFLGILFSFKTLQESLLIGNSAFLFIQLASGAVLLAKMKELRFDFNKILGFQNSINLKLVLIISIMMYALFQGLNSLMLYQLSFIFPKYVESFLNQKIYTNILEMVWWNFSVLLLAPLLEELLFRGIILQKWAIKWGIKTGIIASSLFFAIIHFRFDIISLFVIGIILSILYFKTHNLMTPILSHLFYNTLVASFSMINFLTTPLNERNAFISVEKYQDLIQPLLSQRFFLVAVSAPFLIYFIYKNFPKNNVTIPYYAKSAKILETE